MEIDLSPFVNAGVAGMILVWFMFRLERILTQFDKSVQLMTRVIIRLLERHNPDMASSLSQSLSDANGENRLLANCPGPEHGGVQTRPRVGERPMASAKAPWWLRPHESM